MLRQVARYPFSPRHARGSLGPESDVLFDLRNLAIMASSRAASPSVAAYHKPRIQWLALFLALSGFLSLARASPSAPAPPAPADTLLMDTRVPVMVDGQWTMLSQEEHELRRRAAAPVRPPPTTTSDSELSSASPTKSATTTAPASPLPIPFDGNIGTNFTAESCPSFINGFLTSPTFKSCYPLSMLLQVSRHDAAGACLALPARLTLRS